jgi:hypothetical protein
MDNENWIVATATWNSYPVGTKAKALMGGHWIKTERGWHWPGGGTFPTPGGDATGEISLPESASNNTQLPAEVEAQIYNKAEEIYQKINTLAQEQDPYDFGLPMYKKEVGPIIEVITEYATKLHQEQQAAEDKIDKALHAERNKMQKLLTESETAWASKLHEAEQEIAQLKRWKIEAAELLTPINAYVHKHIEKSLGQCSVKLVLDRCQQYSELKIKYDNIVATEDGHESKTENVWQSGYATGHEAATEKHKKEFERIQQSAIHYAKALSGDGEKCSMCNEKPRGEHLTVCDDCYQSFDGDRRGFWTSDVYQ